MAGWIVPWILRAWFWTCRVTVLRPEIERSLRRRSPVIGALWHQYFLFYADYFRRRNYVILTSRSRDGELVVRVLRNLGYRSVRGSSSRGGAEAMHELIVRGRNKDTLVFLADGPRGPARQAKMGAVAAARHTGLPIVPVGAYALCAGRLRSWDRTALPRPFSRIILSFGAPIRVPPDVTPEGMESWRRRIEEAILACEREAEAYGRFVSRST